MVSEGRTHFSLLFLFHFSVLTTPTMKHYILLEEQPLHREPCQQVAVPNGGTRAAGTLLPPPPAGREPVPSGRYSGVPARWLTQTPGVRFRQIQRAQKSGCMGSAAATLLSEARRRSGGALSVPGQLDLGRACPLPVSPALRAAQGSPTAYTLCGRVRREGQLPRIHGCRGGPGHVRPARFCM